MSEAAKKVTKLLTPLMPEEFRQAEHELQQWLVYADPEATDEHLTDSKYWSNVASLLRAPARIEIWAADGTWIKDARCLAADRNWAKVIILSHHDASPTKFVPDDPDMKVEWAGPQHKWRVVRSDGEVLSKGLLTKEQASAWLRSHRTALER